MSPKEEISTQKKNNVQLLPNPSIPLLVPRNTRTRKAKVVNGNIIERIKNLP